MVEYYAKLSSIPDSLDFTQHIVFGTIDLSFRFFWCEDIQEQYAEFANALASRASADPWLSEDGEIEREYDWLNLYCDAIPHMSVEEVEEWLNEQQIYPQSLKDSEFKAQEVYTRCKEAEEIRYRLEPLMEQLVWHVEISDTEGSSVSGVVRRGGWLNEQNPKWRVQFEADSEIGKNDLLKLTINCEVGEAYAI